jgi:hypothetical protein
VNSSIASTTTIQEVLKEAHKAFVVLSKHAPTEELVNYVEFMGNLISSTVIDARRRTGGVRDESSCFLDPK